MDFSFNRDLPELPEPEGTDAKEVFAFCDLCAYYAQVLEQELINLAVGLHIWGLTRVTASDVLQSFDRMERRTLGQLISDARRQVDVPREIEEALSSALEDRNYLMHRFFVKHDIDFSSNPGRSEMIEELRAITLRLQTVNRRVESITFPLWKRLGITQAMIELLSSKWCA